MSFVEGNMSVGIELAPGTLDRLKTNLANLEKGINLKVNVDSSTVGEVGRTIGNTRSQFAQLEAAGRNSFSSISNVARTATSSVANLATQIAKGASVALAGLALQAIHAGVAFNTLQQKTSGALKAILGGTQQAQALLKQVNDFVNTSPFGRDTFLSATQTLVGFGVEAKNVVPILGAVQNAVGGIGGSDQDILSISQSLARVASSGKLTGDVLFSLQEKGIDAAGILADQFSTTANVIRDQVSAGTIDADKAFTGLIAGLNKKFPDAAANVKNTFTGVVQRMNAAIRDIGGNLTAAFINPTGGGGAVEGVNNIASALRNIQKTVIPSLLPITKALADAFQRASEAFLNFTKGIDPAKVTGFVGALGPILPLLAGLGGLVSKVAGELPLIGKLVPVLDPVVAIIAAVLIKSKEFRSAVMNLVSAISPLIGQMLPPLVSIINTLENTIGKVAAALLTSLIPGLKLFIGIVADTVTTIDPIVKALSGPLVTAIQVLSPILSVLGKALAVAAAAFLLFNAQAKIMAAFQGLSTLFSSLGVAIGVVIQRMVAAATASEAFSIALSALAVPLGIGAIVVGFGMIIAKMQQAKAEGKAFADSIKESFGGGDSLDTLNKQIDATAAALKTADKNANGSLVNRLFDQKDIQKFNELDKSLAALQTHKAVRIDVETNVKTATGATEEQIIQVAQTAGIALNNISADAESGVITKLNELIKTTFPDVGNAAQAAADKMSQKLTTAADNLDKVRAATDSLKASQKSLADLMTVTGAQLADTMTRAVMGLNAARQQQAVFGDKVKNTEIALGAAQRGVNQAVDALNLSTKKRNELLADTHAAAREVADAEATLAKTGMELINQDEQRAELQKDLLRNAADGPDKLAAGDRAIERAKIALNQATREEINLQHQIDATKLTNVDLTGLNVDQIRTKLANVRASLDASKRIDQQQTNTLAEQETTAHLNTLDAAQALKDSVQSRSDIEIALGKKKREDEQALQSLQIDHESSLRRQEEQQIALSKLRAGDTQAARDLKALNIEIANNTDAITTSVTTLHGAEQDVKGLLIDQQTLALDIRDKEREVEKAKRDQKQHYVDIKEAQQKVREDSQKVAELTATTLGDHIKINEALVSRITLNAALLNQNPALVKNFVDQILGPAAMGPFLPGSQSEKDANARNLNSIKLTDILMNHPDQLLSFLKGIGLKLAEGAVINKETFATIGEAGREVVLPLTRPARLAELLAHSDVLPPVLAALQKIKLPAPAGMSKTIPQFEAAVVEARAGNPNLPSGGNVITGDHWEQDVLNELHGIRNEISRIEGNSPISIEVKESNQEVLPRKIRREIEKMISERRR